MLIQCGTMDLIWDIGHIEHIVHTQILASCLCETRKQEIQEITNLARDNMTQKETTVHLAQNNATKFHLQE